MRTDSISDGQRGSALSEDQLNRWAAEVAAEAYYYPSADLFDVHNGLRSSGNGDSFGSKSSGTGCHRNSDLRQRRSKNQSDAASPLLEPLIDEGDFG